MGPPLPDSQQTQKSELRYKIPNPKVKSWHILNATQAKGKPSGQDLEHNPPAGMMKLVHLSKGLFQQ